MAVYQEEVNVKTEVEGDVVDITDLVEEVVRRPPVQIRPPPRYTFSSMMVGLVLGNVNL